MINTNLFKEEARSFIHSNENEDPRKIALLPSKIDGISAAELASQIAGRQKARNKIQTYYNAEGIIYPPSLNLEQSSSEATAKFKASLLQKDGLGNIKTIADLSGGFGIDTFFFSTAVEKVIHIEPNASLQAMAHHNHSMLGANNIEYHNENAESFLIREKRTFDACYVDPSRRVESRKVFLLNDCEPNIPVLLNKIFERTRTLMLKAAPLLDISAGIKSLQFVKKVLVLSVDNECKELIFICQHGSVEEPTICSVNIHTKDGVSSTFSFTPSQEHSLALSYVEPLTYLYEPNASILKAGAFKSVAHHYRMDKLAPSTHLYTSDKLINDFPGKVFKIERLIKADAKTVHRFIPEKKANVVTRNYPLSADNLKKKLQLTDGGIIYLLAFSSTKKKYTTICSRVM